MHAVARNVPWLLWPGLLLSLLAPFGSVRAVTAVVGEPAPGFSIPALSRDTTMPGAQPGAASRFIDLADFRGKVVFLDFWSSWCAPCRRSMPRLDALRQAYAREDFEVIGVNVDRTAADARRFLDHTPVSYPLARDPGGAVAADFGVRVLPALVVIGRDGTVRRTLVGEAVKAPGALRSTLDSLLEEGGVQ